MWSAVGIKTKKPATAWFKFKPHHLQRWAWFKPFWFKPPLWKLYRKQDKPWWFKPFGGPTMVV
jgi:hypothetical protein